MTKRNTRGGMLYLILALLAALLLYLFGWPIASRVLLHRGDGGLEQEQGEEPKPGTR